MKELGSLAPVPLSPSQEVLAKTKDNKGIHGKTRVNYTWVTWLKCKGKVLFKRLLSYMCAHNHLPFFRHQSVAVTNLLGVIFATCHGQLSTRCSDSSPSGASFSSCTWLNDCQEIVIPLVMFFHCK